MVFYVHLYFLTFPCLKLTMNLNLFLCGKVRLDTFYFLVTILWVSSRMPLFFSLKFL